MDFDRDARSGPLEHGAGALLQRYGLPSEAREEKKLAVASQEHHRAGERPRLSRAGERGESAGDGQWIAGSLNPNLAPATGFLSQMLR